MTAQEKIYITVQTKIKAPLETVWRKWTLPEHIVHWNYVSDDWHCPSASNELHTGGKFVMTMAAKDGSVSFDFSGTYTLVEPMECIAYFTDDGREVKITFSGKNNSVILSETFEAEDQNPVEMQKMGWQAILDNFRKYAENLKK